MRLAINRVIRINQPWPGKDIAPVLFTIVEVWNSKVVLCAQDHDAPKKPFPHVIGAPLKYKVTDELGEKFEDLRAWSKLEVINNDFENDPARLWFSKLRLAQDKQKYELKLQLKTYEKTKADAQRNFDIIKAFEYQKSWELNSFKKLVNGLEPNVDRQQVKDNRYLYFTNQITKDAFKAFTTHFQKLSTAKLRRLLARYYAFGQSFESCIPRHHGASKRNLAIRPNDLNDAIKRFPSGRGMPSLFGSTVTDEHAYKMKLFVKSLVRGEYYTITKLTDMFNERMAVSENQETGDLEVARNKLISSRQFERLFYEEIGGTEGYKKLKQGYKGFKNNESIGTGSALSQALFATHQYEVDVTDLDVYLTFEYLVDEVKTIGRPYLVLVTDRATSMIVGFHLTLDPPTEKDIAFALYVSLCNKVEFFKQFDIEIGEDDWPCHHVPTYYVFDNGKENKEALLDRLTQGQCETLGIEYAESYMGKQKATVERAFGSLNSRLVHRLKGAVIKSVAKANQHASKKATFSMNDLYYLLVKLIIIMNNDNRVEERLNGQHLRNNVTPTPRDLWLFDINRQLNGGETSDPVKALKVLLPRTKATIHKFEVKISEGLTYVCHDPAFRKFHQRVYSQHGEGRYEIEVMWFPSNVSHIWLSEPNICAHVLEFELTEGSKKSELMSFNEHIELLRQLKLNRKKSNKKRHENGALIQGEVSRIERENKHDRKNMANMRGKAPAKDFSKYRIINSKAESIRHGNVIRNAFREDKSIQENSMERQ